MYALVRASPTTHENVAQLSVLEYCARHVAGLPARRNAMIYPVVPSGDPMRELAKILSKVHENDLLGDQLAAIPIPDMPSPAALDNIPGLQQEMSELAGVLRELQGQGLLDEQVPGAALPDDIPALLHDLTGLAGIVVNVYRVLGTEQPAPTDVSNKTDVLHELRSAPTAADQVAPTAVDEPAASSPSPDPEDIVLDTPVGDGRHDLRLGAILFADDYPDTPALYPAAATRHEHFSRQGYTIDSRLMIGTRPVHVLARNIDWRIPIFGGRAVTGRALVALRNSFPQLWNKSLEARALILG